MEHTKIFCLFVSLAALMVIAPTTTARAGYTVVNLTSFNGSTNGSEPMSDLAISGNTLYGTTSLGGANGYGEVFSLPVTGGTPTVLASFDGASLGSTPIGGLTISGNTIYGTTSAGGANGYGEVYSLPIAGGTPNVLASFNGSTNGANPKADLTLVGSTLYGTTVNGGANGYGEVFSVPTIGGSPNVLGSFSGTTGGKYPQSSLLLSGSTLYGTTKQGFESDGTVFSIPLSGGTPNVVADLDDPQAFDPESGVTLVGTTLYGASVGGGTVGGGSVYSVPLAGGMATLLASFENVPSGMTGIYGTNPRSGLTLLGTELYGTALRGPSFSDTAEVFAIPTAGGSPTVVATFQLSGGNGPYGNLLLSGTTFYGTMEVGGTNSAGTVYALVANPVVSLTASAPTTFGSTLGTQAITGGNGKYVPASTSFASTYNGYVATSTWNPTTDTEIYALNITDSTPANLNADLALLAMQIDDGAYAGFSATASTIDPTAGNLTSLAPGGFNFFITLTGSSLNASQDYFGFDLSQLNGSSDTLTASAIAVTGVPEPASISILLLGGVAVLTRRPRRFGQPIH